MLLFAISHSFRKFFYHSVGFDIFLKIFFLPIFKNISLKSSFFDWDICGLSAITIMRTKEFWYASNSFGNRINPCSICVENSKVFKFFLYFVT